MALWRMVQHLAHGVLHILDIAGHMGTGNVKQNSDILYEHAGMPSLDGSIKVIRGLTVTLCIDGDVKVLLSKGYRFRSHEKIKFTIAKCGSRSSPESSVHYKVLQ